MSDSPALDLTKTHFKRPMFGKNITVIGSWFNYSDGTTRPCIVLVNTGIKLNKRVRPIVITVDDAWKWAEETGDPSYAANAAGLFAEALGSDPITVVNIIHGEMDELLKIPPFPPGEIAVVADGFVTNEAGKVQHLEIRDRV